MGDDRNDLSCFWVEPLERISLLLKDHLQLNKPIVKGVEMLLRKLFSIIPVSPTQFHLL